MKKLALVLTMSLISLLGIAQIKTSGTFETGYENRRTIIYIPDEIQRETGLFPYSQIGPFYGFLHMEASLKGFTTYTSNKTWFNKDTQVYFNPQVSEFKIGFSYTHKSITTGAEHMCAHSIMAKTYSEFYDRIYIRIKLF
jgi:hypothetical protein